MTRRALVLSSGGARGSFEVGVLEELILNRGLDFHIFSGISAGALNASVMAQARSDPDPGKSVENLKQTYVRLRDIWLNQITGNSSIYCKRLLGIVSVALGAESLFDDTPLRKLLAKSLSPEQLAQSKRVLTVQYTNLETSKLLSASGTDPDIVLKVLASASVPFNFQPVKLDGSHLVDGGVRMNTPIGAAFAAEPPPDEIYMVEASPAELDREDFNGNMNAQQYLMRSIEILLNQIDLDDLSGALELNALKKYWEALKGLLPPDNPAVKGINAILGPIRYAKIIEIRPQKLLIKDGLNFSPSLIRQNYEYGKQIAAGLPNNMSVVASD